MKPGDAIPEGTPDPEVLQIAAKESRVLVSGDVTTVPGHFARFIRSNDSPGLILVPSSRSIGEVIDGLWRVWLEWPPTALQNQARWLPRC